jgi:hypothetical protein
MKTLLLALGIFLSFNVSADTTAIEKLWFDGTATEATVEMKTEKTRTEYRTVTRETWCNRTEWRYRCTYRPPRCRSVCHPQRGCRRVCSGGGQYCRNVPVQIRYRCTRTYQEPYEVLDYYVNTDVTFNYDLSDILNGAGEEFEVKVSGKDLNMSVRDSGEYLILKRNEDIDARRSGDTLMQKVSYDIDFVQVNKIKEALGAGVQDVVFKNGVLNFALGKGFNTKDFIQNIKVYNSRRFRSDVLIFDRNLNANEMDISTNGNQTMIAINFAKLGIDTPSRMRVIMTSKYNTRGADVLNSNAADLEASANWIFSK